MIKELAASDHLPDYAVALNESDMVVFRNRGSMRDEPPRDEVIIHLRPETIEEGKLAAPGWDIYLLEQEWREWMTEPPRDADAAFIGFCRKWFEKRGAPR